MARLQSPVLSPPTPPPFLLAAIVLEREGLFLFGFLRSCLVERMKMDPRLLPAGMTEGLMDSHGCPINNVGHDGMGMDSQCPAGWLLARA
jgi:hypothetical protein